MKKGIKLQAEMD